MKRTRSVCVFLLAALLLASVGTVLAQTGEQTGSVSDVSVGSPVLYTDTQTEVRLNATSPLASDYAFSNDERASMVATGGETLYFLDSNSHRVETARMQSGGRAPAVLEGNVVVPGTQGHNQPHIYNLSSDTFASPDSIFLAWGKGDPYYPPVAGDDFYVHAIYNTLFVMLKPDDRPEDYAVFRERQGDGVVYPLAVFNSSVGSLRMTKFSASYDFAVEGNTMFVSHVAVDKQSPQYNGLVAYDLEANREVWFRSYEDQTSRHFEYYDGRLIGYTADGRITETDAADGAVVNRYAVEDAPAHLTDLAYADSERLVFELGPDHRSPGIALDVPDFKSELDKNGDGNITFVDWYSTVGYLVVDRDTGETLVAETADVDFKSQPSHPLTVGPDGRYLYYVADRTVRVVDLDTGDEVGRFTPGGQPADPYNGSLERQSPRISGIHATTDGLRMVVGDRYVTFPGSTRGAGNGAYAARDVQFAPALYDSILIDAAATDCCVRFDLTRLSGSPASDVTLSLGDATATTDGNGTARFDTQTVASLADASGTEDGTVNATLSVRDGNRTSTVAVSALVSEQTEGSTGTRGSERTGTESTTTSSTPGFTAVTVALAAVVLALLAGSTRD